MRGATTAACPVGHEERDSTAMVNHRRSYSQCWNRSRSLSVVMSVTAFCLPRVVSLGLTSPDVGSRSAPLTVRWSLSSRGCLSLHQENAVGALDLTPGSWRGSVYKGNWDMINISSRNSNHAALGVDAGLKRTSGRKQVVRNASCPWHRLT